jgi:hypothetical protein
MLHGCGCVIEEKWWYPRTDGAAKFSNVTRAQPNTEMGVTGATE